MSNNELGQPIGDPLASWQVPPAPSGDTLTGRTCRVEKLDATSHGQSLYAANAHDTVGRNWTYLPVGPFDSFDGYNHWLEQCSRSTDPMFYALVDTATGEAVGVASYLRITPQAGSIEVGHINYSPLLQRTVAATEAMYLMANHVFALGYRRYEWKCDALNAPSRAAALRYGFTYEGTFRQATVYKGRSRDTAWFSIIDSEWPRLEAGYRQWLAPDNFDQGRQIRGLADLIVNKH